MLTNAQALDTANGVLGSARDEMSRLDRVAEYLHGTYHPKVYMPRRPLNRAVQSEYAGIVARSRVPVLSLVVDSLAQNLYVDGYRPERSATNSPSWSHWQSNQMDAEQARIHRAAIAFGAAYLVVLPGDPVPVWRPVSPRRMSAVYNDRLNDEWPMYALEAWQEWSRDGNGTARFRLYDDEAVYEFEGSRGQAAELTGVEMHNTGFCPVVRYAGDMDLDGNVVGEIEPLIPLQDQLDASTFNIEMAQQYAVHRQRWSTGLAIPEDDAGNAVEPFQAAIDRLWMAEDPDVKFGEFGQTQIKEWLDAREATLRHIAIKSQTPPGSLLGTMINLSAEALAAAEAPQQRRVGSYKSSFGEAHEQAFRLDALQSGDEAGFADESAQVVWRDTESRSLAQVADALGKLAVSLGIPVRGLWEKIPGVTDQDLAQWESMQVEERRRNASAQAQAMGLVVDDAATPDA